MSTQLFTSVGLYNQLKERAETIELVRQLWTSLVPVELPSEYTLNIWLSRYPLELVKFAFEECGRKAQRLLRSQIVMDADHGHRYAASVMRRESERREAKALAEGAATGETV